MALGPTATEPGLQPGRVGPEATGTLPPHAGDVWQAFAAGPEAWQDANQPAPELDGVALLLQRVALLMAGTWPLVMLLAGATRRDARSAVLLAALAAAVTGLAIVVPSRLVRRASRHRPTLYLSLRLPLAGVALAAWSGLSVDAALLGLWPLGVAAGCDVCRTGWALGVDVQPVRWLRRLVLSPVNLGVLVTLAVFAMVGGGGVTGRLVWLYGALVAITLTATVTALALDGRHRDLQNGREVRDAAIVLREHRSRGHWLHDDVCADLRLLRLRLEDGVVAAADVLAELGELDHRLRVRQLDEFIGSGEVRLAEVVQPFLRRAQQLRVVIVESPSVEEAGLVVDGVTARMVQRIVSVLVANAVQAGSPTLAVRLWLVGDRIGIEVEDEAGGFDLDQAPIGRGLDGLRHDLGRGALTCRPTRRGSVLRAVVPTGPGPGPGARARPVGPAVADGPVPTDAGVPHGSGGPGWDSDRNDGEET